MLLSRTRKVMDLNEKKSNGEYVTFDQPEAVTKSQVTLSTQDWKDMGSPDEVTITIVPGDDLNG